MPRHTAADPRQRRVMDPDHRPEQEQREGAGAAPALSPELAGRTPLRRHAPWLLFLVLSVVASIVFARSSAPLLQLTVQVGMFVASTALLGAGWWSQRRRQEPRDPLIGMAFVAMLLYTLATTGFGAMAVALGVTLSMPSIVDATFLLSYVLFGVLLWRLGSRSRSADRQQYLDTLIVVLGAMPMFWIRLIEPRLVDGPLSASQVVYLAYPVMVSVLLGLAVRLAFRAHHGAAPYVLLGGWIVFELVGDVFLLARGVAGTYAFGQPWQALWVLSVGCLGALALHPGARGMLHARQGRPVRGRTRLVVIGVALTGPTLTLETTEGADTFCLFVTLMLIIAMCLRLSGLMVDVAEQRRSQQELQRLSMDLSHQARHDSLTGLANRALLNERLGQGPAQGACVPTSVVLIDLDDFKTVNDSLGHAAGDRLLVEVARRITLELRVGDLAGRLGGDEFVVVLDSADVEQATALANRLLASLAKPIALAETEINISVSVGIATSDQVSDGLNLLGAADMAMYLAKQRGKAAAAVFEPQMHTAADERLRLDVDLRRALRGGELFLAYQPIVDLRSGALAGVEALVRWDDAERGMVSPELFIPLAERTGVIHPLGAWVLRESAAQLARWDEQAPRSGLVLNINVSTRQLERPGLLETVDELIAQGLDPTRLVLEITETALTLDGDAAAATLQHLRARGVRMAVDDFGTGYSSLSRLKAAPVSQLKIDRSFVSEIETSASLVPIIQATVAMADGLGLGVVAEGVETTEQLQYLRRLGCAHAQGYLLARPQDAQSISDLLASPRPWAALLTSPGEAITAKRPQPRGRDTADAAVAAVS